MDSSYFPLGGGGSPRNRNKDFHFVFPLCPSRRRFDWSFLNDQLLSMYY